MDGWEGCQMKGWNGIIWKDGKAGKRMVGRWENEQEGRRMVGKVGR